MSQVLKSALAGVALFCASSAVAQAEDADPVNPNLLLMGSAPQICSSMNQDACQSKDWIQANEMRTARLFNLSDVRRREAMRRAVWPRERDEIRDELIEALEMMADHFGYGVVPENRLVERFRSRAHLDLLSRMTEAEYYRVLDGLEMAPVEGLREHVNLEQTKGSSARIMQRFVDMAARNGDTEQPTILVVTAGARDTLGSYGHYQRTFEAAGANVQWLPMDATVKRAQQEGLCESLDSLRRDVSGAYDRARIYEAQHKTQTEFCKDEDAWQGQLADADGVFFIDGNPELLRAAFFQRNDEATPLLTAMRNAHSAGELVVAAAGGGSIAMASGTMITNGSSREAMKSGAKARPAPQPGCEQDDSCPMGVGPDTLTYQAMGGLGLYPYGLIDIEVSERGRQARMLRLAADTTSPLATGIDRSTALLVDTRSGDFEVMGDSAVFFVEQATGNETMAGGTFHFVRHQSRGVLSRSRVSDISLADQESYRPESITTRFLGDTGVYDNIARLCEGRSQMQLLQDDFVFLMQRTDDTETKRVQGRCQVVNGSVGVAWQPQEDM